MHWHSYGEIVLVGPGKPNIYKINQSTYELVEDDLILLWPMEMHATLDADRKKGLVIQYGSAFMNSLFDLQRIMHYYRDLHVICVNTHPKLVARLKAIIERMKNIFFSQEADRELRCCMLLMEFMLVLDQHKEEFESELGSGTRTYEADIVRRIMKVTDYIKNNLTADDLSQGTMAKRAGISKDYFSRVFKNVTGMNYSKWLNMVRLERATELLAQEDLPLTKVAMLSGFQSIPSFNRVFHSIKGMAPREYRALFSDGNDMA